jgi:hypothetical protein
MGAFVEGAAFKNGGSIQFSVHECRVLCSGYIAVVFLWFVNFCLQQGQVFWGESRNFGAVPMYNLKKNVWR